MPSDLADWARIIGLSASVLTLALLVHILALRAWVGFLDIRRQRLWSGFRPLMMEAACGLPPQEGFIRLNDRNWLVFFKLWHQYLLNVQGEAREHLRTLGRRLGLHHVCIKRLNRVKKGGELMAAIIALGWLRDIRAWEPLMRYLHHDDPVLSFAAARSLTRIDPGSALREVMPLLANRLEWSQHQIAALLMEAGPLQVSKPLLDAVLNTPLNRVAALLRFLNLADAKTCNEVLFHIMQPDQEPQLIRLCLKAANSPRVLELVRVRLNDADWAIRVDATSALSRIGNKADIDLLLPLLCDPEWWVRYRTAQAIGELMHRDLEKMNQIAQTQTDKFACDMLKQVISEWKNSD